MFPKLRLLLAVGLFLSLTLENKSLSPAQEAGAPLPADIVVQTRGPVHEAYAQPFEQNPEPGLAVPKEPPPPLPEVPPEERPSGDNVQWVGGYWAWDAERNDYSWVSGTYRNTPPGRQFIPGHWVNTPEGWRWVAGFWAPNGQSELPYADQPPAPLETEPGVPPPDDNSTYIPGYWFNSNGTFVWRPGFYTPLRVGRIWCAPRYIWTPAGYLFCDGYWDYPLEDRGLLFAPVWFNRPLWRTAGWFYRPNYLVRAALLDSLFWRNNHYYFGNYYGSAYSRLGYQPWFTRRHDPLVNYYRGTNPNLLAGHQRTFNDRVAGRVAAPPLTLAQQNAANRMVAPLASNQVRLTRATSSQLAAQNANIQRANQMVQLRNQQENVALARSASVGQTRSMKLPALANSAGSARNVNQNQAAQARTVPYTGITTRPTGKSNTQSDVRAFGTANHGVVVNNFGRGVQSGATSGVPRVLNNSVNTPRVLATPVAPRASTPLSNNHVMPQARAAIPQTRSFTPAARVTPSASHASRPVSSAAHASRPVSHAPARSGGGGGGHRGGKRGAIIARSKLFESGTP